MSNHTSEFIRQIIHAIEGLEAEKSEAASLIYEKYRDARMSGFDVPTLRKVVALRKKTAEKRAEEGALLDMYTSALDGIK